ncbi:hypothetical protein FRC03_005559 [Tulasnella sp. 419]|nr:hypothetical protein FRC02_006501 [Tulasnella sp. 418]KAG8961301.1 hypothetical protein FRC03_005559 [Tulasnella sp. 419]
MKSSIAIIVASVASANAHTIMQKLWVNGVDQGYLKGIRYPTYDGPITDVTSQSVICNGPPNPLTTPYPTDIINIPAGATVTTEWHHVLQPNGYNPNDSEDPIAKGHNGPIMHYLAKVDSALTSNVSGLKWFKIHEEGLYSDGTWAVEKLIAQKGKISFQIPSCIPPGNYFLRAELIALHAASSYPGAQLYMECAQINITGGGTANPPTVSFPGAYSGNDPGIKINLYNPVPRSYTIPGPRPFTCGGTQPTVTQPLPSSTSSTTRPITDPTTSRSSTRTTTTSGPVVSTVPQWGQCGGANWTGPTVCVSPFTCKKLNDFYSQCV